MGKLNRNFWELGLVLISLAATMMACSQPYSIDLKQSSQANTSSGKGGTSNSPDPGNPANPFNNVTDPNGSNGVFSIPPNFTGPAPGPGVFGCKEGIQTTTQKLRIMFMVDNSGSTAQTDPQHLYRVQTIQNFLAKYATNANFTYNFGDFSDASSYYDITRKKFTSATNNTFGVAADLSSALSLYSTSRPGGTTNYVGAFAAMEATITADENAGNKMNYVAVFMSDGMPKDLPLGSSLAPSLIQLVDGLRTTANANGSLLSLSTVYFGAAQSADPNQDGNPDVLKLMALEGQGQFVDTNVVGSSGLQIDSLLAVPSNNCPAHP